MGNEVTQQRPHLFWVITEPLFAVRHRPAGQGLVEFAIERLGEHPPIDTHHAFGLHEPLPRFFQFAPRRRVRRVLAYGLLELRQLRSAGFR